MKFSTPIAKVGFLATILILNVGSRLSLAATHFDRAAAAFQTAQKLSHGLVDLGFQSTRAMCVVSAFADEPYRQDLQLEWREDAIIGPHLILTADREYFLSVDGSGELSGKRANGLGGVKESVTLRRRMSGQDTSILILRSLYGGIEGRATFYCWWEVRRNR